MKISLFPLDVVLFPGGALPLHIFEDRYREMIARCREQNEPFGVVRAQSEGLAVIGCTAEIVTVMNEYPDGRLDILCRGGGRFEIEMLDTELAYLRAEVDFFEDEGEASTRREREECAALHFEVMELAGASEAESAPLRSAVDLDKPISFLLASNLPTDLNFKQQLLSTRSDAERCRLLLAFYNAVLPKLRGGMASARSATSNGRVM